jgi:hypothetical protein
MLTLLWPFRATGRDGFSSGPRTRFHRHASIAAKVKSLSPNRRLMIAVLSPDGLVETGLRERPPEKNAP